MEPRLARTMGRREAITLVGLGLIGCAAPSSSPSPDSPRPFSTTARVEPIATPNSIEQRVRTTALNVWKDLLSKDQEVERSTKKLSFRISDPDVMAKVYEQALKSGAKPTDTPLKARWVAPLSRNSNNQVSWGEKWIGEIEFNNIEVQTIGGAPTDSASRANGVEWVGGVQFKFIERNRSSYEYTPSGGVVNKEAFQRWFDSLAPHQGLPDFSPWYNSGWGILLSIQQDTLRREGAWALTGLFSGMEVPTMSDALKSCSLGCKKVIVDLK